MAEVVGYNVEGTILCLTHAQEWAEENNTNLETDERASPIFDDEKWNYIPTCEECRDPLSVTPTEDGLRWIVKQCGSNKEADWRFPFVGGRWYELAQERGIAPAETVEEEEEEEILAKMRRIDEILKKLFRG
jgi:hypothetical protein